MKYVKKLPVAPGLVIMFFISIVFVSCQKEIETKPPFQEEFPSTVNKTHGHLKQTKTYPADVVIKWLDLKYRILRQPQEQNTPFGFFIVRFYSALGISVYESVVPGMPAYQSLSGQLSEMPPMPATNPGMAYHWPACANAALAQMFRNFLPNTSLQNKASIDSLDNALNHVYMNEVDASTFQRSAEFGKAVAGKVFEWLKKDGFFTEYSPYIPPVGPGLWQPTPPAFLPPNGAHFGDIHPLMPGVLNENYPPPPVPYSTVPGSTFHYSMIDVYNTTQQLILNPELKAKANYWRGTPGGSGMILWYAILRKILTEQGNEAMLDKAAIAYCKMGIAQKDAGIAMFKAKFFYNELAPVTYIRDILGHATWNSDFPTPAGPCYPELHAFQNSSSAAVLSQVFGSNYHFNTDGIHPQGQAGYTFNSFEEAALHGNQSRFLAGVGTQHAMNAGAWIGNKSAEYMDTKIKFLK